MPESAFNPQFNTLAFEPKPEQKVQDPFNTKVKGKDSSRVPQGYFPKPIQTAER